MYARQMGAKSRRTGMAVRGRLERPTYGLEGSCSVQLSYRTIP